MEKEFMDKLGLEREHDHDISDHRSGQLAPTAEAGRQGALKVVLLSYRDRQLINN